MVMECIQLSKMKFQNYGGNMAKKVICALSALIFAGAVYSGAWYYYYSNTYLKHTPDNFAEYEDSNTPMASGTRYVSPPDEKYSNYFITKPKFGHFVCVIGGSSALGIDDEHYTIDENGNKVYDIYNMSGSDFQYAFRARLNMSGNVKEYTFDVHPSISDDKYAATAFLVFDTNGNIMNKDDLSSGEYAIYNDANPEICEYIRNMNETFHIT